MSLQILHCSDLHLDSNFDSMNMDDEALQSRKKDLEDTFTRIVEYAGKNKPDVFLISGDIFDLSAPSKQSLVFFTKSIKELEKKGTKVFLVWGDHDFPKVASNSGSAIDIFKNAGVGTIFGSTRTVQKKRFEVNGKSVCISGKSSFPVSTADGHERAALNVPVDGDYNILVLHGQVSDGNTQTTDERRVDNHEIFNAAELPKGLNYVAIGQNHNHFEHDLDTFKLCNAGSPERLAWSELDEQKGFVWAELNGSSTKTEFVKLPTRKMERKTFDLSSLQDNKEIEERIGNFLNENRDKQMIFRLDIGGKIPLERNAALRLGEIYAKNRNRFFHLQLDTEELESLLAKSNVTQIDPIGAFVSRIDNMASMPDLSEGQRVFLLDLKKRGIGYLKGVNQ